MWVNPEINAADAFVAAWLPGSEGEGIADVLFRSLGAEHVDFTGRLGFSWPQTGMPVRFDDAGHVSGALFARGWGLSYGSKIDTPALSEDPGLPTQWLSAPGVLFRAGHVVAPWSIFIADDSAEVHLTTQRQENPSRSAVTSSDADGNTIVWSGGQRGLFTISGRATDLRRQAAQGVTLELRYRVDRVPAGRVQIGLRCTEPLCGTPAGAMLDVTPSFKNSRSRGWQTLAVPLSCFSSAGADLGSVVVPFALETADSFGVTLSEVKLAPRGAGTPPPCPGRGAF
jgi:beta-glucosidase